MESKINPFPFLVKQANIKPMNLESESLTNERPWPAKVVELGGGNICVTNKRPKKLSSIYKKKFSVDIKT